MNALYDELKAIPKIELHAHLSGSVRNSTISEFLRSQAPGTLNESERVYLLGDQNNNKERDLKACFQVFPIIHRLLSDKDILARVTREVLEDFESENCVYLELRTTPRNILDENNNVVVSKVDYLNTVIGVIQNYETEKPQSNLTARLLVSIDRSKGLNDALDMLDVFAKFRDSPFVVGVDFSGNPQVLSFREYDAIFKRLKEMSVLFTIHIGEIPNDPDLEYVLKDIRPHRVGHCVCLDDKDKKYLFANPIPIEICPTSNLKTKCVESLDRHPFGDFYAFDQNYPLCICTDDPGVFDTHLTNEAYLLSTSHGLNARQIFDLYKNAVNIIFDKSETTKTKLSAKFAQFEPEKFYKSTIS